MEHRIIVASIGPGHPDYVLPAAARAIKRARVLVGGARALSDHSREGQETMTIRSDVGVVMDFIRDRLEGDDVVVMVSGDPGYYSMLDALRREFPAERISVIVGVGAIQFAFARLSMPWHDASLLSFHGRRPTNEELRYSPGRALGMLTDTRYNSHSIPRLLIEAGWPEGTEVAICSRLSYEDERIVRTTLKAAQSEREETHCVMVVMG